jgi:hypothetical protein
MKKRYLAQMVLGFALLGVFCAAKASTVAGNLIVDWSTFRIIPVDTGNGVVSLSWTSYYDISRTSVGCCNFPELVADNWTTGTRSSSSDVTLQRTDLSSASTSSTRLQAEVFTTGSFEGTHGCCFSSDSAFFRSGNWTAHGNGMLLFQVNYTVDLQHDTVAYEHQNFTTLSMSLDSNSGHSRTSTENSETWIISHSTPLAPLSKSGILEVSMYFHDGWSGNFLVMGTVSQYVFGNSVVPLPSAVWLLASGLIAFTRLRRSSHIG